MIFIPNRKSDILSILNFEIILYDKFSDGIEKLAEFWMYDDTFYISRRGLNVLIRYDLSGLNEIFERYHKHCMNTSLPILVQKKASLARQEQKLQNQGYKK